MKEVANLTLRFPKELRDWLSQHAAKNARSLNSELIVLVREEMRRQARKKETPTRI